MQQKMKLVRFLASSIGRVLKAIIGVALVLWGFSLISDIYSIIVMAIGGTVFLAGVLNFFILSPLLRIPFWAKNIE